MSRTRPAAVAARLSPMRHLAAALPVLLAGVALHAQPAVAPASERANARWTVGAAFSRPLLVDGNGVEVQPGIAPTLGVARAWRRSDRVRVSLGLRGSRATVGIDARDGSYSAGTLTLLDLTATLERSLGALAAVHGGAALVAGVGPEDVQPFRLGGRRILSPALELGASVRVTRARPVFAVAAVQAYRAEPGTVGEPGVVHRLILVLRHGL